MNGKSIFGATVLLAVGISYFGYAASFLSSILVARLLGAEGKGVFSLFMESTFGIVLLSSLGIGNGQIYEVSKNPKEMIHFLANAFFFSITFGTGVALLYYLAGLFWHFKIVTLLKLPDIILGILVIPILTMVIFQRQYFLANHSYKMAKANGAMTTVIPMFIYLIMYGFGIVTITHLIMAFVLGQLVCFLVFHVLILKSLPKHGGLSIPMAKKSISFGIWQYLSDLCSFLIRRLDFFLVISILGQSGLGIYSVAVAMAEITSRLTHEIGTILFPEFASDNIAKGRAAPILRKTLFSMTIIASLLALASRPLILLLFGNQFAESIPAFQLLLLGTIALGTIDVTWNYTAAKGKVKLGIPIFGIGAILDVALNFVLLPSFGVLGASFAATISYCLAAFLFLRVFCKNEGCSVREALVIRKDDIREIIRSVHAIPQLIIKRSSL